MRDVQRQNAFYIASRDQISAPVNIFIPFVNA